MAAMATQDHVETELGRALTSDETERVGAALDSASDFVRAETERRFAAGTFTVTRRVRGGVVHLDSPASVTGVVEVDRDGGETSLTGWTLRGSKLYGLGSACWVEVTYTSDGEVPEDLARVVAAMAARDLTNQRPEGATSYTSTSGPFTESATFEEGSDSSEPTRAEARTIRRYAARKPRTLSLI